MRTNGRVIVVVAAVAVAAVATGGMLAARNGPKFLGSAAVPLTAPTSPSPQVSKQSAKQTPPTSIPSARSTSPLPTPSLTLSTPTPPPAGSVKLSVELAKLGQGRDPQVTFVVGREVRGGAGWLRKIPGTDTIHQVARLGDDVLAVVSAADWRLIKIGSDGKARYTPDVSSLVGAEGGAVAYAAVPADNAGGVVYAETEAAVQKLAVPASARGLEVLRVGTDGKVYFHWKDAEAAPWKLFEWTPGSSAARRITTVGSAREVSADGAVAISTSVSTPGETTRICSTVMVVATGKQSWRTCDSVLSGFTPGHSVAIGVGDRAGDGSAGRITAQDTTTGAVIREWTGRFETVVPEDDQHLLIVAVNAAYQSSIIRCAITTGSCETAVRPKSAWMGISGE